jgi:hypothetical protein
MVHKINPATSIVIESYLPLGLERRLRRYERVRDVMNSWDRDSQNSLLVLPCDIPENDKDLDLDSVRRTEEAPAGFTCHMYYASKPGKWAKRYITLLDTGEVFSSKKAELVTTDKETVTLCHLTDFDIYSPTESQLRRSLKPPKKFCYAIKSQQKSSLFINTDNFVHYFCIEDATIAHKFHEMVHRWRSWYLVNKRVDVQNSIAPQIKTVKHAPKKSISVVKNGSHRLRVSVDETPYAIGAFEPLLDLNRFDKPIEDFGKDFLPEPIPELPKLATHRAKEIPKPRQGAKPSPGGPPPPLPANVTSPKAGEFASKGLLGHAYDARKQGKGSTPHASGVATDGPFTEGPSLLNGGGGIKASNVENKPPVPEKPESESWFPSAIEHSARQNTARQRSQSMRSQGPPRSITSSEPPMPHMGKRREKPKPLVDLSSKFPEPPHWRDGKGHGIKAPAGTPLVDLATGPTAQQSKYFVVPSSRNYQRRDQSRVGNPMSPNSNGPQSPQSPNNRPRSRSTAGTTTSNWRLAPQERPPVPPLPLRLPAREKGPGDRGMGERRATADRMGDRTMDARSREHMMRQRSGTVKY